MRTVIIKSNGPDRTPNCRVPHLHLAGLALLLVSCAMAGCSTTPALTGPAGRDTEVVVHYDLRDGVRPIRLPVSDPSLTIHEVRIDPEQRVVHRDGERWLLPEPGTRFITVHVRYRLWPRADGWLRDSSRLFPGADRVEERPEAAH